jgi:pimeloyl-ACP methyl ester carboxylesterase
MTIAPLSLLVLLALLPDPGGDLARLEMKPVELTLPGGAKRTAYRGMLRVPIVRADRKSKEIGVDVWRFPAEPGAPEDRLPLFQLHGGPGWPGYEPNRIDWESEVAPFVAHSDFVVVGQRGIGTSEPNTACDAFARPIDADLCPDERAAAVRAQCSACRAHWESEGYDLAGFNVVEAAADVDDVRRLLGYEKIALIGGSFGSHWGMTVLRHHPDAVARALLHGMEGPDHTYDSPSGVLGALERIAARAEASPALAERVPEDGLIEALRFVIQSVEEQPFELEVDGRSVPITAEGLRGIALGYEGRVASRQSVAGWPKDVIRLYEGEFEAAARAIAGNRGESGLPTASFFQLDCGSGITAARLAKLESDPAIEIVGDLSWFYEAACPAWNADLGDGFRADFTTKVPTVIVHGTWDVSTPFTNALELLGCFENLHFVPVEGGTHGALREAMQNDPAFADAVMAFLFEGETEALPDSIELPPIEWIGAW